MCNTNPAEVLSFLHVLFFSSQCLSPHNNSFYFFSPGALQHDFHKYLAGGGEIASLLFIPPFCMFSTRTCPESALGFFICNSGCAETKQDGLVSNSQNREVLGPRCAGRVSGARVSWDFSPYPESAPFPSP